MKSERLLSQILHLKQGLKPTKCTQDRGTRCVVEINERKKTPRAWSLNLLYNWVLLGSITKPHLSSFPSSMTTLLFPAFVGCKRLLSIKRIKSGSVGNVYFAHKMGYEIAFVSPKVKLANSFRYANISLRLFFLQSHLFIFASYANRSILFRL